MPSERDEFLAAIQENWTDLELRAIYADWLAERGEDEEADRQRNYGKIMEEAKQWIAKFSEEEIGGPEEYSRNDECVSVDDLVSTALTWTGTDGEDRWGEYIYMGTNERYIDIDSSTMDKFWEQIYVLTGKRAKDSPRFFSCAC